MPMYDYKCEACNHADSEFQHMSEEPLFTCPKCGKATYRKQVSLPANGEAEYLQPIHMHSIGLAHPDEIEEFKRRNPGTQISDNPDDPLYGVPVIRTRKEKLNVLKNEGYVETK